jgi:uncharacterized protein
LASPENPLIDTPNPEYQAQAVLPGTEAHKGENPVWSGKDVLQIALLMFLSPFVIVILVSLVVQRFFYRGLSWPEVAGKPSLALLSEFLVYGAVVLYMYLLVEGRYHRRFLEAIRWNWPRGGAWKLIGLGIVMLVSLQGLAHVLPIPKTVPFDQFFKRPLEAYITSVFAVSIGPLMEELFFRAFLYPVLARRLGMGMGVFLTGLAFGLIHALQLGFAWAPVLLIFLVGIVLTIVRALTQSVAASFVVHAAYNSTLTVLTFIATDGFRHLEKLNR